MTPNTPKPVSGPEAEHLLAPPLPYRMLPRIRSATGNIPLQQFVDRATIHKDKGRAGAFAATFGDRLAAVREHAGAIRQHTLDHLDHYLAQFVASARAAGAIVHFAPTAADATRLCTQIARDSGAQLCVKSKSMVTEEIHLLRALEAAGVRTVETDLGEFILQLDGDAPSHIVTPMIHKDRTAVARAFVRELGAPYTEDPAELTMIARAHLRELYRRADLGVSGANFLLADTGAVVVCTNEGNGDYCVSGPRTHVVVAGIEKVLPRVEHLGVFLKLLARSSTAQPLTVYTTILRGPRRSAEPDGPERLHIILVNNGRTRVLAGPGREALRCIRCGACLNACPVYRKVGGGHAYGAVYSGPIGAILTPMLKGVENYPDLPQASSLCGACSEACPVKIDIPAHLVRLRAELLARRLVPQPQRLALALWAAALKRPALYRWSQRLQRLFMRTMADSPRPCDEPGDRWLTDLPGPLEAWTRTRDFPAPAERSFRDWWAARQRTHERERDHP